MKRSTINKLLMSLTGAMLSLAAASSHAEDIDIFVGSSAGANQNPKILIILENDSNWSRQAQKWPGGGTQGQSEATSIKTIVNSSTANVNIGLMEYATSGSGDAGGFIRKAITALDTANKADFSTRMDTIYNNINDPNEKVNSAFPYGDLMWSAYNYFSGTSTVAPSSKVVSSIADSNGYTANYTTFKSPLSDANSCGRNFVIFIGNNANGSLAADSTANGNALVALGGSISPQLKYQNYTTTTSTSTTNLGYTSSCYASLAACTTADFAAQCVTGGSYDSCTCSATNTTTSLDTCAPGQSRFAVYGQTNTGGTTTTSGPTAQTPYVSTPLGISSCYSSATVASTAVTAGTDKGGLSCPAGSTVTAGNVTTTTTNACAYALNSTTANATASASCPGVAGSPVAATLTAIPTTTVSSGCYSGVSTGNNKWSNSSEYPYNGMVCPATTTSTVGNVTTTTSYTCSYTSGVAAALPVCSSGTRVSVTMSATPSTSTVTISPTYKFDVKQTVTPSVKTVTTSGVTTTTTLLGNTSLCYASGADAAASTQFATSCVAYNGGCIAGTATAAAGLCPSGARYMVTGNVVTNVSTPTGATYTPTDGAYADEWARFMHQAKAKNAASSTDTIKQAITTYTIDVFNAQQNTAYSALLQSMANAGGGKYFAAKNEAQILAALQKILAEIQSVNSTFASASLPVNATNRTQNANQVFIGTFRPDPDANPRWFGNLKQYAIGRVNGNLDLVDKDGRAATNALTGFVDDCASSFWTTDSGSYWGNLQVPINPDPASNCGTTAASARYSDLPDGPQVEKGAVAEVLRKGNDPSATTASYVFNRNMLTLSGTSLVTFSATSSGLSDASTNNLVGFTQGKDVNNDTGNGGPTTTTTRPSIHGDVVHSRPLPINYGGTTGVTVYYGSNDGTFRAVDATTAGSQGKERWSFVAPEFFSKLQRQKDNAPLVSYPSIVSLGITSSPKDYFFDGSIGIYQNRDNSKVWIYPTQRRGGRMIYAFDVSDPTVNPTLKWRHGCPNLTSDTGCTTGGSSYSAIGQTWSTPNVAFIRGFSTTTPVVLVGGGYDNCEDVDSTSLSCGSAKGRVVYLINADTGDIIRSFTTDRSVAADISFIDLNNDGSADYAYAADTGGNIYRIDFVDGPTTLVPLASASWNMRKVAYTNGRNRKFLFAPGVFPTGTTTYVALVSGDRERPLITNYPYTTPVVNKAYVYKDDLTVAATSSAAAIDLDGSTMIDFTDPAGSTCATVTSNSLLSPSNSGKNGWYLRLTANGTGEQGVTAAVIVAGMVTFSTNRPIAQSQTCGSVLGEARGYFVNLFNASGSINTANNASCGGDRSSVFAGGGLPPSPVIGIVPIDGVPTAVLIGAVQRDTSSGYSSPIRPEQIKPPITQVRTRTYKSIKGDN